jgi:hypothetical protein
VGIVTVLLIVGVGVVLFGGYVLRFAPQTPGGKISVLGLGEVNSATAGLPLIALGLVAIGFGAIHGGVSRPTPLPPSPSASASSAPIGQCADPHGLPAVDGDTKSDAEAREALRSSNFFNILPSQYVSAPGTPGRVLTQSPRPGTLTCPFDSITLTVRR